MQVHEVLTTLQCQNNYINSGNTCGNPVQMQKPVSWYQGRMRNNISYKLQKGYMGNVMEKITVSSLLLLPGLWRRHIKPPTPTPS